MNTTFKNNKCFEMSNQEIYRIQAQIVDLLTKCPPTMASSDSVIHKIRKIAQQLLAAVDKTIEAAQDLNAITSCMFDVVDNAEADDNVDLPHILAWAGWTGDLTSDVLDAADC